MYEILQTLYTYLNTNWTLIFSGATPPKLVFPMHTVTDVNDMICYVLPELFTPDGSFNSAEFFFTINIYSKTKNVYEISKIFDKIIEHVCKHNMCGIKYLLKYDRSELMFIYTGGYSDLNVNGLLQVGIIKMYYKIYTK